MPKTLPHAMQPKPNQPKYVEENSKACPNEACGYRIQKNLGCDHMTCRQCRQQFCWLCLADYRAIGREGNTAHTLDYAYHTNQIARREGSRLTLREIFIFPKEDSDAE